MDHSVRWLFFDLGSTLINEDKAIADRIEQMVRAFAECGQQVSMEAIERALKQASAEFAPAPALVALERLTGDPATRDFVRQSTRYRKELEEPYPETRSLLAQLAPRYRIGIIANQSPGTLARLASYGLDSYISCCLASAELGLEKPDPAIFRLALEQAQCGADQAVMIGDRLDNDIRPAKSLGFKTIRVLQGWARVQRPRTADEEPDATVQNLMEIAAILGGRQLRSL